MILVGDINIAHKEIDLKNWKGNRRNSGFLPEERAWMTRLFEELGFVDVFRTLNPHPEQYTWWSNRGQARAKNVGWRLDYHLATPAHRVARDARAHLPRAALQRSCAGGHRLRLHAVGSIDRRRNHKEPRHDPRGHRTRDRAGPARLDHHPARPGRRRQRLRPGRARARPRRRRPGALRLPARADASGDDQRRPRHARLVRHLRPRRERSGARTKPGCARRRRWSRR